MNNNGIMTNRKELEEFDSGYYEAFDEPGVYQVKLDGRSYYNGKRGNTAIRCYFSLVGDQNDYEDDDGFYTYAWRTKSGDKYVFSPKDKSYDFGESNLEGTMFRIEITKNERTGYIQFQSAELIHDRIMEECI